MSSGSAPAVDGRETLARSPLPGKASPGDAETGAFAKQRDIAGRECGARGGMLLLHTSWPLPPGKARGERAGGGKYPPAPSLPGDRSTTEDLLRMGAACASCSLMFGEGSSGCRRCENEVGARGVVGVKRDCDEGSGGGSSFSNTDRCVARRVIGLGVGTAESEADDTGEGFGKVFAGRSSRKGSGLACVTGELSTASRTGSKAGILRPAETMTSITGPKD